MKKKKIKFISRDPVYAGAFTQPGPAYKDIPQWVKDQPRYIDNKKEWHNDGYNARFNNTVKACPAVYDVVTSGYLFYLDADVHFQNMEDGGVSVSQAISKDYQLVSFHPRGQIDHYKFDREYWNDVSVFKFQTNWRIEVPKGYSCLYTHPMWRDDLPFKVLPGIIDQDRYRFVVNFFFLLKRGFEGTISSGTPIGQIIPFKRDEWKHQVIPGNIEEWQTIYHSVSREIENGHKKENYTKKRW